MPLVMTVTRHLFFIGAEEREDRYDELHLRLDRRLQREPIPVTDEI